MNVGIRLLNVCCLSVLSINAICAATVTVNIDDVYRYGSIRKQAPHTNYVIQAGAFSAKVYATQYKEFLDKKITSPVRIEQSRNRYYVVVGPFSNASTMVQAGRQIKQSSRPHRSALYHPARVRVTQMRHVVVPSQQTSTHSTPAYPFVTHTAHTQSVPVRSVKHTVTSKQVRTPRHVYTTSTSTTTKGVWKDMVVAQPLYRTGPYVGASVGPQWNISSAPTVFQTLEGTVSAGWGHLWTNRFYLAAEAFGADGKKLKSYPANPSGYTIQSNWSAGVDVIPGYMLTDTFLGYLRLGWVQTDFNIAADESGQATFATTSYVNSYYTRHMNTNGWQVGVGGQTNVYRNLDLRAEYIFSLYNRLILINKPQVSQFNVGLVYKFEPH